MVGGTTTGEGAGGDTTTTGEGTTIAEAGAITITTTITMVDVGVVGGDGDGGGGGGHMDTLATIGEFVDKQHLRFQLVQVLKHHPCINNIAWGMNTLVLVSCLCLLTVIFSFSK